MGWPLRSLAAAPIVVIGIGMLLGAGSSASSSGSASGSMLPRSVVVPLSIVKQYFPEVTHEAGTSENSAAVGDPRATRLVIYANSDGSRKVTLSVDQYDNRTNASSAFHEAVERSKSVPGYKPLSVPTVGQETVGGIVTQGTETHAGIGAVDGDLIIGATIAGYDATRERTNKLIALMRRERAAAKKLLGNRANQ